jgi:hypothetical protein
MPSELIWEMNKKSIKNKNRTRKCPVFGLWGMTGSNRRPSACKADALNQLS